MKICVKKFVFISLPLFVFFAVVATANVYAQSGGIQSANLGSSITSKVSGRVGGGVFERLSKRPVKKKAASKRSQAAKNTRGKNPAVKSGKNAAVNNRVETEDFTDYSILTYKPDARLDTAGKLVNDLAETADERALILELFKAAKTAYDDEAAKKGKKNDVALALSFFLASCVTVYNDAPEPGEQAFENLYDALSDSLMEEEQFALSTDREKQEMSETLIYIGGLVIGGYTIAKQTNDENTLHAFQNLAGVSLSTLTRLDPEKMSFNEQGLVINP